MLAAECMPYVRIAANLVIFILFCIKFRGLVQSLVLPYLKSYRQEIDEHWFALQEKHLVLVTKKKQLATQFLQQEKQIALLTAKLESWKLICAHKEQEHQNALAERAEVINRRAARQQYLMAQNEQIAKTVEAVTESVFQKTASEPDLFFAHYIVRATDQLAHVNKRGSVDESPCAKKAEGA